MEKVVLPPTDRTLKASDLLDQVIERFLAATRAITRPIGHYESDVEGHLMMRLIIRHSESVTSLCRTDLVLLPSAFVLARAAYETGLRLIWMMDPDDPYDREVRWLALMQEYESYHGRLAQKLEENGGDASGTRRTEASIKDMREHVERVLPSGHKAFRAVPSFAAMLAAIQENRKYLPYIVSSQYTHGTLSATELYRKNLGTDKEVGEFIDESQWHVPFIMCWFALHTPGRLALVRTGGDPDAFLADPLGAEVQMAIEAVRDAPPRQYGSSNLTGYHSETSET